MVYRGAGKNMVLIKNKKGVFFTTIAIVMLSLFFITYSFFSKSEERENIKDRVSTMNSFVFSIEKDMSRQLYISSHRAILSIESYILNQGAYMPNAKIALEEALFNGTINSQNMSLMEGYILNEWKTRVANLSSKLNLITNYTIQNLTIEQDDPWNLLVIMAINLSIDDKGNLASWRKTSLIEARVNIEGFEDPLYLLNTNGLVTNVVRKTKYSNFVSGSDISNLSSHLTNSYYIASAQAPSFLDRLEGKTTSNQYGIESLVNLAELSAQGIPTQQKSVVDYIYFSSSSLSACNVAPPGMPSWFRLDDDHLSAYQVNCA